MDTNFQSILVKELESLNENQKIIANNLLYTSEMKFTNDNDRIYIFLEGKKYIFSNYVKSKCGCP